MRPGAKIRIKVNIQKENHLDCINDISMCARKWGRHRAGEENDNLREWSKKLEEKDGCHELLVQNGQVLRS